MEASTDYRAIFHSLPDLYLILDPQLNIIDMSDAYARATMTKRADVSGRHIFEIFPDNPGDSSATGVINLKASLSRVLRDKKPDTMAVQKYDVRRPPEEGGGFDERYWSPHNAPVLDEKNRIIYIIHRVQDVTDFIRLEQEGGEKTRLSEELRTRTGEMEMEIFRRAQELQEVNRQLRAAMEAAEEASKAKSAFLAAMSHEIRTPLNSVIGMTSILLDSDLDSDKREIVEIIRVSGESLLFIINDILDFSKIESGRIDIENVDFNLRHLIDEAVEITATDAQKKGVEMGAEAELGLAEWFNGDPTRIRQILVNILGNSVKFTEKGEIRIKTKLHKKLHDQNIIAIEVSDTGIGIKPDVLAGLFQPFIQGDSSITRKYGGTGLGLIISKRLAEFMGGTIEAESCEGKGSKFTVFLPLKNAALSDTTQAILPSYLKDRRLLVVDDSAINREIIKKHADAWSMFCDTASSAEEALFLAGKSIVDRHPYHLILADYILQDMKGTNFVTQLRQMPAFVDTPVIMLSSPTLRPDHRTMEDLGILSCLTKPLNSGKLCETITTSLGGWPTEALSLPHNAESKARRARKNIRILLVEDNNINQLVAIRMLNNLGYRADIAGNGAESLDAVRTFSYDLILMDCQMPVMDGYTAATEIRRLEQGQKRHTPIIAMTAFALQGDREKCLAAGMDDYIAKPITPQALQAVLEKWAFVDI